MKYKIFAIILTVFLSVSAIMYGVITVRALNDNFQNSSFSILSLKNIFLYLRDNDAANAPARKLYIDLNGAYHAATGKRYVHDIGADITKLDNGYLANGALEKTKVDEKALVEELEIFDKYLNDNGIEFLYVQAPEKICKYDDQLATGVYSGFADISQFLEALPQSKIDYIDLEKEMHDASLDHYELFFKTDHHWTVRGGFFAHQMICEKLKRDYSFEFDDKIMDISNYQIDKYEKCFIGSQGRRVGRIYSSIDDAELLYPKFDTNFSVNTDGKEKSGSFYEAILFKERIADDFPGGRPDYYGVYLGGDHGIQVVTNHNSLNDKKIVLVRDSFSCVTAPFLSMACKELHILDLRHIEDISAAEYAVKINADMVIVMYNAGAVGMGDFFKPTPGIE